MQLSEALGIAALVAVTLAGFAGVVVVLLQLYNIVVLDWVLAVLRRDRRPADGGDRTVRPARFFTLRACSMLSVRTTSIASAARKRRPQT
jgi:hypothetical protein